MKTLSLPTQTCQQNGNGSGRKQKCSKLKWWLMQNSCGEHHVTYISWQGIPFICVRWPVPKFSRNSILRGPIHPSVPRKKECLWCICTWGTHTNNKLWWSTWKNCCLVTRERKLAMDIVTYVGDMGGQSESPLGEASLWETRAIWEGHSLYSAFIHALIHV